MSTDRNRRRPWQTEAEWKKLRARIERATDAGGTFVDPFDERRRPWQRYSAYAAAACALVAVSWFAYSRSDAALEWKTVSTVAGQLDTVSLGDSTVVALGPATTVRYALSATRREVQLEGLASFSVVHDAKRPFHVRARNATIRDIGTEFSVRAYAEDSIVRVSVSSGIVDIGDVAKAKSSAHLRLSAGSVGHVTSAGVARREDGVDATVASAWQSGQLLFENESLRAVVRELNRWFGARVGIDDTSLAERRVTAVYNEANIRDVLAALSVSLRLDVVERGDSLILRPRNQ
jgi:transmembrane sensor